MKIFSDVPEEFGFTQQLLTELIGPPSQTCPEVFDPIDQDSFWFDTDKFDKTIRFLANASIPLYNRMENFMEDIGIHQPTLASVMVDRSLCKEIVSFCQEIIVDPGNHRVSFEIIQAVIIACDSLQLQEILIELGHRAIMKAQTYCSQNEREIASLFIVIHARNLHAYTEDMAPELYKQIELIMNDDPTCSALKSSKECRNSLDRWEWYFRCKRST